MKYLFLCEITIIMRRGRNQGEVLTLGITLCRELVIRKFYGYLRLLDLYIQ